MRDFFDETSVITACWAFGNFEIRNVKPKRFKNQSSDTMKLLGRNCKNQQGFIKKQLSLSIIGVLS